MTLSTWVLRKQVMLADRLMDCLGDDPVRFGVRMAVVITNTYPKRFCVLAAVFSHVVVEEVVAVNDVKPMLP